MPIIHSWDLQETSGTTVADSVGGNTGTKDSTVTLGATGPGSGFSNAAAFAGTTLAPITLASTVNLPADDYWYIDWWAFQAVANTEGMMFGDNSTNDSFAWFNSGFTGLRIRHNDGTGSDVDFTLSVGEKTAWNRWMLEHIPDSGGGTPTVNLYQNEVLKETLSGPSGGLALDITHIGQGFNNAVLALEGSMAGVSIAVGLDDSTSQQERGLYQPLNFDSYFV